MDDEIQQRKTKAIEFFKKNKKWIFYVLLILLILFSANFRTNNIPLFKDKYLPDVDSYLFYRYADEIVTNGELAEIDTLRYYPLGFETSTELLLTSDVIVLLHKTISIFNPSQTVFMSTAMYPVVFFALAIFVFFFLVRRLFKDDKIALLSTAFLAVIPTFLYRTMAGVSDKEPLAMFLMMLSLYLFVVSWQAKNIKNATIFGILAGISTGLMGLAWAGVSLVTLLIGLYVLIEFILGRLGKKEFITLVSWNLINFLMLRFMTTKYVALGILSHYAYLISIIVIGIYIVDYLIFGKNIFKIGDKLSKYNRQLTSIILTGILGAILVFFVFGFSFVAEQVKELLDQFIFRPGGVSRFQLTVAENQQPYFTTWLANFGKPFFWLFFLGSITLFYELIKSVKKYKWILTASFALFISGFIFSRYKSSSVFNGTSFISKVYLVLPLILLALALLVIYLRSHKKDPETYQQLTNINSNYILVLILFAMMLIGARSSVRLLFTLSIPASIMASFFILYLEKPFKSRNLKILAYIVMIILLYVTLFQYAKTSSLSAGTIGPSYHQQWQTAERWVLENTPEDSIFIHWWDYGYWVQTMWNRATVTDGGNLIGYWNHLVGRHVLTGHTEDEALEVMKTHDVTHLLIVQDEIGKYGAFSSIGGDANNDRLSYVPLFGRDNTQTLEQRDKIIYVFTGSFGFDGDFIYNDVLFTSGNGGIGAVLLPVSNEVQEGKVGFEQPTIVAIANGQQYEIPLKCIYFDGNPLDQVAGEIVTFPGEGYEGCFRLVPIVTPQNQIDVFGGGLFISEKVRKTRFTQLYLFDQETENMKLVYSDANSAPLAMFGGRLVGPIKIWEVSYPSHIKPNPQYLETNFPSSDLYLID